MSYNSWSLGRDGSMGSPYTGGAMGSWGGGGGGEREQDKAIFASLLPVNGKVSGPQVKNVFQASGLTRQQLAQIWTMADRDGDGYIDVSEFCSAMTAIRQAKLQQQHTSSLQWPGRGGSRGEGLMGLQSLPLDPSQQISKSLAFPSLNEETPGPARMQVGGAGRGVPNEGWAMTPTEKRRYVLQFGTHDRTKSGFLAGSEVKPILKQSGLEQALLAKIWTLSDADKDGRLSAYEFAIAMHLIEKAKKGLSLPTTLPAQLLPGKSDETSTTSSTVTTPTSPKTFEDKRRENFDAGKQELERRRRAIQEKQEREEAERERKRRQEAEQKRQQELEAEKRRQAELERQNRRAMEIQQERERQLAKLAEQREAEQREAEKKRKEEWARRRRVELEGVKEWEMKTLRALQSQHSNLENELQQLDQQKMASRDSVARQSTLCDELRSALRSMRLSDEVKRAEITKLRTELQALQSRLASLATQRAQLQASLQSHSPQSLQYQRERQVYQDGIMGVAAVLAGLRSTLKSGAEAYQKQQELMSNNTMLSEMQTEIQKHTAKSSTLKAQVAHHRSQWEERERRGREEERRRQEAEKRERQEKERLAREAREERIRREQKKAIVEAKVARVQEERAKQAAELSRLMSKGTTSPSPSPPQKASPTRDSTPPTPSQRPDRLPPKPAPYRQPTALIAVKKLSALLQDSAGGTTATGDREREKRDEKARDKEVKKKVSELKQRKAEIDKKKPKPPPAKPTPYGAKKQLKKQTSFPISSVPQLLDIESSGDHSGQNSGFRPNPESSFNPLQPQRAGSAPSETDNSLAAELLSELREAVSKSGQGGLSKGQTSLSKGKPIVVDKTKATVTESQAEASSSLTTAEPIYSIPRKNTRSSLDYGRKREPSATKSVSVSPPPKDWVVVDNEEVSQSNKDRQTTPIATTAISTSPDRTSAPLPATSTPKHETTLPSWLAGGSARKNSSNSAHHQPLSSSWVDLQSTANEARGDPPTSRQRGDATSTSETSSVRTVTYHALYSFEAEREIELSFKEGDILNGIPGELPSNGWLMVEVKGRQGLVPESYLEEARGSVERELEEASQDREPPTRHKRAKVLYNWKGSKVNQLAIKKGEIIRILSKSEKWWSGEREGQVGWFPKTFVKIIEEEGKKEGKKEGEGKKEREGKKEEDGKKEGEGRGEEAQVKSSASSSGKQLYQVLYDYDSVEPGDLQFKAGDIIQVTSKEADWWKGSLNGQTGVFPCNYVQPYTPSSEATHRVSPSVPSSPSPSLASVASDASVMSHEKPLVAKVTRHYEAKKERELDLKPGQYIKVYKQASNGWWEGELQSRGKQRNTGWFPADCVELQKKKPGANNTPPSSSSSAASSGQPAAQAGGVPNVLGGQRARSPLIDILDPPDLSQNLVLALYTYTAASGDELTFHKGSVITVLSKSGDWWKGELNGAVGLFPSNYVQPLNENATAAEATRWAESVSPEVLASVSKTERKRQEAIFELLSSERNYTDSLKFVREVYFEPMVHSGVLTDEEMSKVRVNWDDLIECNGKMLNAFLVRLRTSGSIVKNLGDILHTHIPLLEPHIRWCSCQLTACTLLQSKSSDSHFKEFEQKCAEDPRAAGLPLSSFLLKPMQRITKYPLLIQKIIDYTTEDHMDHDELKSALMEAQRLCHSVNEAVRRKENTEQLEWLQNNVQFTLDERLVFNSQTNFMGQRRLLHWGKLFKIRGNRDLVGFLFNDFFLLVKPKNFFSRAATPAELEPFGKNEFVMYRTPYLLGDTTVSKAPADQHGSSVFLMNYPSEEKDIPLRADSDPARDVWIKMIQDAKHEYLKTKRRSEQEMKKKWAQTMKHTVGVLKVTVVKGEDLMASDPNGKSDPFCVLSFSQQEENTPVVNNNLNPKWNYTVTFAVHDLNQDVLEITVFDKDIFSPNDFLGCGRVVLKDLLNEGDSPWRKQVLLEDVSTGEVELVLELKLNKSDLLL